MDLLPKPIKRNVKVFFCNIWLDWERIDQLQSFDLFSAMAVFSLKCFSIRRTSCVSDNSGVRWSDCSISLYCCSYFYKAKWQTSKIFKKVLIIILYFGFKFFQGSQFNFPIPSSRQFESTEETNTIQFPNSSLTAEYFILFSSTKDFSFLCDLSEALQECGIRTHPFQTLLR